jgi:hypothetical protein
MSNQPRTTECKREGCSGPLLKSHLKDGLEYCSDLCEAVDAAFDRLKDNDLKHQGMSERLDQAYTKAWVSLVEVADALSRHREAATEVRIAHRARSRSLNRRRLRARKAALRAAQNEPSAAS